MSYNFESLPRDVNDVLNKMDLIIEMLNSVMNHKQSEPYDDLMTVEEAAAFLSLQKSTIYTLTSKGSLPVLKGPKRSYYKRSQLIEFLENNVESKKGLSHE